VIDVDVHIPSPTLSDLMPFLTDAWRQHIFDRRWRGTSDAYTYPPRLDKTARPEWRLEADAEPQLRIEQLREQILDALPARCAILNCVFPIDLGHPDLSAALARAANDWIVETWLSADDRLRASIVLPGGSPQTMAAEVDRVGAHPGFVQALLPVRTGNPYGRRVFHPLFDAIVRHDLVAGVHWGGSNGGLAPTPCGWPSYYAEEYSGETQIFEGQLISMIAEGLFQAFPSLRVSFLECGFTWVPWWLWNADRVFKGVWREVPWVDRPPFEIVRDQVRFSTAPTDAGPPAELAKIISWLGSDDLLMFATDYPHMHDDDLTVLLEALPPDARQKTMHDNASSWYRL
jgi:predicted TIM-barrel fold metal-dependent hydrolase